MLSAVQCVIKLHYALMLHKSAHRQGTVPPDSNTIRQVLRSLTLNVVSYLSTAAVSCTDLRRQSRRLQSKRWRPCLHPC